MARVSLSTPALCLGLCCFCFCLWSGARAFELEALTYDDPCSGSSGPNTMLRELRAAFSQVKTFFQKKDQLDNILLTDSLLQDFKGYLGCQALSEMIKFYLVEVMPQAENHGPEIKEHLNSLGEKLKTLWIQLRRCVSNTPPGALTT